MADSSAPRFSLARLRKRRASSASIDTDDAHAPLVATVAFVVAAYFAIGSSDFCMEGAWTHLAFARSLRLGDGFVFQRGEPAGSASYSLTSPLWDLLLALAPWRVQPVVATKLCGALCHGALAWGALRLGRALVARAQALSVGVVAGLCVACDPLLVFAAGSGMEVPLTAALLVWTLESIVRARDCVGKHDVGLAVLLGAGCVWANPLCVVAIVAYALLSFDAQRIRRALWVALGGAAAGVLWFGYRYWNQPLPSLAQLGPDPVLQRELSRSLTFFVRRVLPEHAWFMSVTGAALVWGALLRSTPARALALAWLCSVFVVAGWGEVPGPWVEPDFPVARNFAVFAALPCIAAATQLPARFAARVLLLAPIVVMSAFLLPTARAVQRAQEADVASLQTQPTHELARWLPDGARLVTPHGAAARFFLPRSVRIIDLEGPERALVRSGPSRVTLRERWPCVLLLRRPTHVFVPTHLFPQLEQHFVLVKAQRFGPGEGRVAAQISAVLPATREGCGLPR